MTPIVHGLAARYEGRVTFQTYNVATPEGKSLFERYRFRGHPAYVLLDAQGNEAWRGLGQLPEETLSAALDQVTPR